ncbi:MAG: AAA family ATPase [Nannocystis sp.]|nr:AAA family ATPase [Nannocystis sp.]MBA3546848.1 AAA family ATPase [Nannocystis sp.]
MRLEHAKIQNFKAIRDLSLAFLGPNGEPRPLTLLLGDNGSGKTTALQAIALALSLATRRVREPVDLDWPGFLAERVGSQGPTRVELAVIFDDEELEATRSLFTTWIAQQPHEARHHFAAPGNARRVDLIYEDGALSSPQGDSAVSQFLGRYYIRDLLRTDGAARDSFPKVGGVFWFDQNRNLATLGTEGKTGINRLRNHLVRWYAHHTSKRVTQATDYLQKLEDLFARFFPGARFVGTEPRRGLFALDDFDSYFLIQREDRVYDIAEMSSGEQAIFPMLYEFARLSIARSIVLIDELELHLHPPLQQMMLAALRMIGPDCQFIVSTHSPYLEEATPDEFEIRLPGGRRCL